jgi:hypothetical protein
VGDARRPPPRQPGEAPHPRNWASGPNNATIAAALATDPAANTSIVALVTMHGVENDNTLYFPCVEDAAQCDIVNDWFVSPGRTHCYTTITDPFEVSNPRDPTRKNVSAIVCQCDQPLDGGSQQRAHELFRDAVRV